MGLPIMMFGSLFPRLSTWLHRKYGGSGTGGEKEREPGTNRSHIRKFNCRKHENKEMTLVDVKLHGRGLTQHRQ